MIRMGNNLSMMIGFAVVLLLVTSALVAPWLTSYSPTEQALKESLEGPSRGHPLGQDRLGRDLLSRLLYGARVSLWVGAFAVGISLSLGLLAGSFAGFGGLLDELLMRLIDVLQAFPGILLAIAFSAVLGPSLTNVVLALSLVGWVGYARLVRGQVLSVRELEYVEAARALGAGPLRILFRHVLPNVLAPVVVQASFGMAGAIVAEASLSFLGLGTQPPTPSWGAMLNEARVHLLLAPHLVVFPGLAVALVVLGFNFLGDGLRDLLDVKQEP